MSGLTGYTIYYAVLTVIMVLALGLLGLAKAYSLGLEGEKKAEFERKKAQTRATPSFSSWVLSSALSAGMLYWLYTDVGEVWPFLVLAFLTGFGIARSLGPVLTKKPSPFIVPAAILNMLAYWTMIGFLWSMN